LTSLRQHHLQYKCVIPCFQDIQGVDYIDTKLLEGTEHEHLLKDLVRSILLACWSPIIDPATLVN
jgi:hypothetical protein